MSDYEDYALERVGLVHVSRIFGIDVAALRGVDLRVANGQRVTMLGPSGSGKSTLLSIAAGVIRPSVGRISLLGVDIGAASEKTLNRIRRNSVGRMLQGAATNFLLPVAAQAAFSGYRAAAPVTGQFVAFQHGDRQGAVHGGAEGRLVEQFRLRGLLREHEQGGEVPPVLLIDRERAVIDRGWAVQV